jgi:hypothetical protein
VRRRDLLQTPALAAFAMDVRAEQTDTAKPMQKKFKLRADQIKDLVRPMGGALATDRITVDGMPVGYMYREAPDRPEDSGWRFFAGNEDQAYVDDPANSSVYSVNTIANYDPDIIGYLETPAPCAFEKVQGSHKYQRVEQ